MVLSNIDIQDKPKQSREERYKMFIECVHEIESYSNIDDVPKSKLEAFRNEYFAEYVPKQTTKKHLWRFTDQVYYTNDERLVGMANDLVNGISIIDACLHNHMAQKYYYRHCTPLQKQFIRYQEMATGKIVEARTYNEMVAITKAQHIDAPNSKSSFQKYISEGIGKYTRYGKVIGKIWSIKEVRHMKLRKNIGDRDIPKND